jgi:hypothetical protein
VNCVKILINYIGLIKSEGGTGPMNSGNLLGRKQGANSSKMGTILEDKALSVTGSLFQNGRAFFTSVRSLPIPI